MTKCNKKTNTENINNVNDSIVNNLSNNRIANNSVSDNKIVNNNIANNHNVVDNKNIINDKLNGSVSFELQVQPGKILLNYDEYNTLINENCDLRSRILDLCSNERLLNETIRLNNKTIDDSRKENNELKLKLATIEKNIQDLTDQNKQIIKKQQEDETKKQFAKFIVAIQDLNRKEELYKYTSIIQNLTKLKRNRILDCNYLDDDFTENEIEFRRTILFERISNMDKSVYALFNKIYPNLLEGLLPHIKSGKLIIPDEEIETINQWWDF